MKKIDSKYRKMLYEKDSNFIKKRQKLTKTQSLLKDNWSTNDYKVKPILKIPFIFVLQLSLSKDCVFVNFCLFFMKLESFSYSIFRYFESIFFITYIITCIL